MDDALGSAAFDDVCLNLLAVKPSRYKAGLCYRNLAMSADRSDKTKPLTSNFRGQRS